MKIRSFFVAIVVAASFAPVAFAQSDPKIEITPFYGYRFGGDFEDYYTGASLNVDDDASYGASLGWNVNEELTVELLWSRQDSGIDVSGLARVPLTVDQWMVGGFYRYDTGNAKFVPFLGGGLGFTHFGSSAAGSSSSNRFGVYLDGGIKYMFSRHVGLRADLRGYFTFVSSGGGTVCGNYGCYAAYSGSVFIQGEGTGGLVFAF